MTRPMVRFCSVAIVIGLVLGVACQSFRYWRPGHGFSQPIFSDPLAWLCYMWGGVFAAEHLRRFTPGNTRPPRKTESN